MVDFTDGYEITSNGIDIGRDGNAVPWSRTPWNSSIDFERSTRNLVQTTTVGGRTFEVYAEPDRLGRGPKGLNYDVEPADGGETPFPFSSVMTSEAQVQQSFSEYAEDLKERVEERKKRIEERKDERRGREDTEEKVQTLENGWVVWTFINESGEQRWYVETDDGYLQSDASTASTFFSFPSQSSMESTITDATTSESVAELGYGWVLGETPDGEFFVVGRNEDGKVYLEGDGSTVSEKKTYASKSKARRAFRRWREENVGDVRQKNNETRLERSERFQEALEQRRQGDQTSPTVEVSRDREESMSDGLKEIENFGNGWKLVESPNAAAGDPNMIGAAVIEWYVRRQTAGGFRYINREGESTTSKTAFSSKTKARKAYQRWKNDNSGDSTGSSSVSTQSTSGGQDVSVTTTRGSGGGGGSTGSVVVDRQPSFSGGVSGGSVSVPDETDSTSDIPTVALAAGAVVVLFMLR